MVKASQITVYGLGLINAMLSNRPYNVYPNTTLNEKFNVLAKEHVISTSKSLVYPRLKYFGIGIGGVPIIEGVDEYKFSQHSALDAALFKQIPFALKKVDNDFLPEERDKYRLRVETRIKGESYYAYYLKVASGIDNRGYSYIIKKVNGIDTLSRLDINTDRFLNPVPVGKPIDRQAMLEAPTVINRFKLELELDDKDNIELQNVLELLDLPRNTKLNELAVCFGHEQLIEGNFELVDIQIGYHVDIDLDVKIDFSPLKTFKRNIELGGAEPLFVSI